MLRKGNNPVKGQTIYNKEKYDRERVNVKLKREEDN